MAAAEPLEGTWISQTDFKPSCGWRVMKRYFWPTLLALKSLSSELFYVRSASFALFFGSAAAENEIWQKAHTEGISLSAPFNYWGKNTLKNTIKSSGPCTYQES